MTGHEFDPSFEFATEAELAALYLRTQHELRQRVPVTDHHTNRIKALHEADGLLVIDGSAPHYELELPAAAIKQIVPEAHRTLQLSEAEGASVTLCHSTAFYEWIGEHEPNYCAPDCSFTFSKAPESGLAWSTIHVVDSPQGMESDRMDMRATEVPPRELTEQEVIKKEVSYVRGFLIESLTGSNRLLKGEHQALVDIVEHLGEIIACAASR